MKTIFRTFLALTLLANLSGCVNTSLTSEIDPSIQLSDLNSFYVVHQPRDKRSIDQLIAKELTTLGKDATFGGTGPNPEKPVDAVITYEDKWMWDITMYLLELNIELRDPQTNYKFGNGKSYRTSLARKSPEEMVKEVLNKIFGVQE